VRDFSSGIEDFQNEMVRPIEGGAELLRIKGLALALALAR
jgi:hypothetical protein